MRTNQLLRLAFKGLAAAVLLSLTARLQLGQNQAWTRDFGTSANENANAAAPDGAGGVYLGGLTSGDLAAQNQGNLDAWLGRLDGAGNTLWLRQLGSSAREEVRAVASDGAGGVFASGSTMGALGGPSVGFEDTWLAHYDGAGNLLWIRQFGTSDSEGSTGLASDGVDGVYVGGWTFGAFAGPNMGQADAWLARYDGAGTRVWIRQLGDLGDDSVHSVTSDGIGGAFVAGITTGSLGGPNMGQADSWLGHYDSTGTLLWMRQPGTTDNDHFESAAPDGTGGLFVIGMTGWGFGGSAIEPRLAHFDGAGNPLWILQFGRSGYILTALALASDGAGGVYACGESDTPTASDWDGWLARFGSDGSQLWTRAFDRRLVTAAATDDAGGVYVSGRATVGPPYHSDIWVARCEPDCGPASVTLRNSAPNPVSFQATPPMLGRSFTATVDLTTTGHSLAYLFAYDGAIDRALRGGQHLLCADLGGGLLYERTAAGPLATFQIPIRNDTSLCGQRFSMQAVHFGGSVPFALSNAQDLVIGF